MSDFFWDLLAFSQWHHQAAALERSPVQTKQLIACLADAADQREELLRQRVASSSRRTNGEMWFLSRQKKWEDAAVVVVFVVVVFEILLMLKEMEDVENLDEYMSSENVRRRCETCFEKVFEPTCWRDRTWHFRISELMDIMHDSLESLGDVPWQAVMWCTKKWSSYLVVFTMNKWGIPLVFSHIYLVIPIWTPRKHHFDTFTENFWT